MGEGSSGSGPAPPPSDGGGETARVRYGREPTTQPRLGYPVQPSYEPVSDVAPRSPAVEVPDYPATIATPLRPEAAAAPRPPGTAATVDRSVVESPPPPAPPSEVVRYGPGVPASQAGVAAESVWRTGQRPGPPARQIQLRRVRRLLGLALTVILLIAAGVVVWLRFLDHPAFRVSSVRIIQQTKTSCGMDLTGLIATNGAAGTVSYQWVFRPQTQAPQPLSQSVVSGQHDVYVTVAVEGQGHGSATQTVTLDVLGPDPGTATRTVTISC
jgi:hypothetical protein